MPVPKRPVISSLNDLRPVALTSAVMEMCERVVLCKLDSLVKDYIDRSQFAYRRIRSTDNAVLYVLENIYSRLEKADSSVSSANFTKGHDSSVLLQAAVYSENRLGAKTVP